MLNSVNARPKKSTLEVMTGYFVILIFIFLCIMCAVCAFVYSIWEYRGDQLVAKYITGVDYNFAYNLLTRLGNWMLVFGTLVPISMLLTLETAKFCQGYIMGIDKGLVDKTGMECEVHSSNLNEELGQVDYIFSDKTGTLTQNEMRFKYLVIGKTAYGEKTGYTGNMPKVSNVDFSDPNAWDAAYQRAQTPEGQKMRKALQLLALCHTIVREKNGSYNASSPDELAFVNVAKLIGCEFLGMDDENYILVNECGQQKRYKLLDVFEFNSDRKRMSVVVQDERGTITLFCKGADSIIAPRYTEQSKPDLKDTMVYVDKFADIGLRTLLLGYKEVSSSEYQTFKSEYDVAKNNLDNRDKEMARVEDKFERGMTIVGATAIEDRLQDQLPETIEFIRNGGVKIWVLTGDKVDTAKNIGFSARLLVKEMEILQYPKDTPDLYQATLKLQDQQDAATQRNIKSSLLVAGDHLETIMSKQNQALFDAFSKLALGCEVVLCCRVTPKQKQEVVAMVKKALPKIVSLAIGDGANDVNMITEAHVGVGIKGVEGQQAARAADFAIGEFRLLKRLMFFHGRESYRKNSNLVLYNFFKNIMLNFPNFWFGWSNYFSGQTAYEELGYQLFNLAFTSLPIGIYALFDRQTSDVVLMKDPKYYRIGPLRLLFNSSRFVRWFIWAIAYSFIVYLIALNFFDLKFSSEDGTVYGFRKTGQVVFVAIIFLTNLKIVSFAHSYSIMLVFLLVISSMLGIFVWIIVSSFDFGTLEHSFSRVIWSSQFWTAIFILIGVAIFDWAVTKLYHYTIMREHYPPGTEEEFLMDVQKAPSDAYVKQTAMQNILERSNTQNFQERMESDDHDDKKSQQSPSEMQTIRH